MANIEMNVLKVGNSEFEIADAQARQDVSNLKDDFHEYHSDLGAGYADQIVSSIENEDSVPYNFRAVPYDATLEKVEGIVGVDVVLNQQINSASIPATKTESGVTFTNNGDGTITVNGTATADIVYAVNPQKIWDAHKYLMCGCPNGGSESTYNFAMRGMGADRFDNGNGNIWNATDNTWKGAVIYIKSGATVTNLVFKPNIFDLTQIFGTTIADYVYSLETATAGAGVAWLKEHFPKIFDAGYIAYNAGTMVCVSGLSEHKTVGFNQWDEEWEVGDIDSSTGQNVTAYGLIRSINYIPVLPNTSYYFALINGGSTNIRARFYDANKNYIGYSPSSGTVVVSNAVFVTPNNCAYMRFATPSGYGSVYNHDICINLSDPAKNGQYEPYTVHTYPLDSTIDLHGILKLDSNNNLYADGDVYKADGTVQRRYGVVDLGSLNWSFVSASDWNCFSAQISDKANGARNFMCAKYVHGTVYGTDTDKIIIGNASSAYIYIRDTSYTDAASFKASLSEVLLVYEKATASTEQAEPYTQTQICDPNGTEEYISDTVAPVGHVTKYPLDIAGRLDNILSMPSANGTYTLRAVVNNGKVTYSWVSA